MILYYIDESGTGLKDRRSPYFILSAMAIPAELNPEVDRRVLELKRRLINWARPEDFEIKGRDLRRGDKLFSNQKWEQRAEAILLVADLLASLPIKVLAVQVDTRDLPEYISSDTELYRIAFWRLLDAIEIDLTEHHQPGMLLMDARSDLHSSVQDKRTVQAFRDWLQMRSGKSHLLDLPWFGFSAFYAGLQLADFAAYLVDFVANETRPERRGTDVMTEAFRRIADYVTVFHIP